MEEIFKYNPTLEVVFVTSDDQVFYTENDAKAYAKSLKDSTVTKLANPSLDNGLDEQFVETPAPIADEVPAVDAPEAAAETLAPVADEVPAVDAPAQDDNKKSRK